MKKQNKTLLTGVLSFPFRRPLLSTSLLLGLGATTVQAQQAQQTRQPPQATGAQQAPATPATATLPVVNVTGSAQNPVTGPTSGYVATDSMTGSKTNTPLSEIPQSISVVTQQEMRDRNDLSVAQAVQYVPGVQVNNFGGNDVRNDWIVLRGFDAKISGDYRDGLSQMPYDQIRMRMDPYALERIDVIRGPSSVLYGQVAPGGIVNRVTKRPTAEPFGDIGIQFGSWDRQQAQFDLGGPIDKDGKYLYRLTGIWRDAGTQDKYGSGHRYPDDLGYIAPAFTWQPDADTSFTLLTNWQHDRTGGESRPVYPTHTLVGDYDFNKYDREQYSIGYQFSHRFNSLLTVRQNARYQKGWLDQRDLYALRMLPDGHTISRYALASKESADSFVVDNQAEWKFQTGPAAHTLLTGIDYQFLDGQQHYRQGTAPTLDLDNPQYGLNIPYPSDAGSIIDLKQVSRQMGLYVQDQVKLDKWILTLGGRQDWARSNSQDRLAGDATRQDDDAFTGRAGLGYQFDNGVTPYVSYSTSFLPQAGAAKDSTPFRPTKGEQYEVGVKYQPPGGNSYVAVAVYDLTQKNVLTTDPTDVNFSVQTGKIRSRGIELEGKANLTRNLDLLASYTFNDIRVKSSNNPAEEGNIPIVTPEHMASAWLNYTLPSGLLRGLGMGAGVRYIGKTYADVANTITNDDAVLFDAGLHYEIRGWRLGLNVINLFNKETIVCRNNTLNCRYGQERTFVGTLSYSW
ncbi:TonB-dependent siderophore receptor [Bordetella genomosp. 9]|uniref:TonB-dependent siderophore receptor n=1 Tax=Bordetella genomosp. 9 TaxID=1416803 RepID=A0A261RI18_9BORD|nr:TonB-dependent siderophore receptor [Bordetella genomosp. 9]OZI23953.1 TonB-dependent siderophore receptor [Bordetella genomosp. 9]